MRFLLLSLCLTGFAAADEPLVPVPDTTSTPPIRWPMLPSPVGPPAPIPVMDLSADRLFIVESDTPFTIVAEPQGIVAMSRKTGPYPVFSRFADGSGEFEERVYNGKFIILILAKAQGRVALVEVTDLDTPDADRQRKFLNVMGPRPPPPVPPVPPIPVPPDPDPDPPTSDAVLIEVIEDPLNRSPDTAIVLSAMAEWNALKDKGHDWRIYSVRTTEPAGLQAITDAGDSPLPTMVVRDKATKKVLRVVPLPLTMTDVKRVLSELTGGIQ